MSSYSSDASRSGSRSPLFGTATFSTMTQSESSPTRYSYSSRSGETISSSKRVTESIIFNVLCSNVWHSITMPIFSLCDVIVLFVADTVSQESLLMTAISLGTTCVESQSPPRHPTDILVRTCILGPRMTPFEMMLRLRLL